VSLDNAEQIYQALYSSVPAIGFLSRKERVLAYISVTKDLQNMIDAGDTNQEHAMFVLSLLMRKHKDFQKAGMMTSLNLQNIGSKALSEIGFNFANEIRNNMKLYSVEKREKSIEP
jgi:hypothetical protein